MAIEKGKGVREGEVRPMREHDGGVGPSFECFPCEPNHVPTSGGIQCIPGVSTECVEHVHVLVRLLYMQLLGT